jgi:hypothetical protein
MGYTAFKSAGGSFERSKGGARFGTRYGDGFNNTVYDFVVGTDSELYLVGTFTAYDGETANRIIKLTYSGRIATDVNYGTGFNGACYGASLQSDGKLLCVGDFSTYKGSAVPKIIRIATNGNRDTTLVTTGWHDGISGYPACVSANAASTKIAVGVTTSGAFNPVSTAPYYGVLTDINGTFITSLYNTVAGSGFIPNYKYDISKIKVLASGRVLSVGKRWRNFLFYWPPIWYDETNVGYLTASPPTLTQIDSLGILGNKHPINFCLSETNSKFYLCGGSDGTRGIWRFSSSGSLDATFNCTVDKDFYAVCEYNGEVYALSAESSTTFRLRKFDADGSELYVGNESYLPQSISGARLLAVQSKKIVAAGAFTKYYTQTTGESAAEWPQSRNRLARFHPDKTIDKTLSLRH